MRWIWRRVVYPPNKRAVSTIYLAIYILHFKFSGQHATKGAQNSKKAAGRSSIHVPNIFLATYKKEAGPQPLRRLVMHARTRNRKARNSLSGEQNGPTSPKKLPTPFPTTSTYNPSFSSPLFRPFTSRRK